MDSYLEITLIDGEVIKSDFLDFETIELIDENNEGFKYVRFWLKHCPILIEFDDIKSIIIKSYEGVKK